MKHEGIARMPAQRQTNQNRLRSKHLIADATAKARKPKPSAPRRRKHSYQRTRKKRGKKSAAHQKHISMHGQRLISPIQKISTSL
ncbi:hypothetical protein [Paraburkholderia hospita]|uniref:hypothetical protein n=1 Tax=Paraburkholderia hospita TaxID=169430 RepID=UPI00103D80D6|nr:hypothetical protein [Paraburkholderia hospita]